VDHQLVQHKEEVTLTTPGLITVKSALREYHYDRQHELISKKGMKETKVFIGRL
jgi:hypothetical protein